MVTFCRAETEIWPKTWFYKIVTSVAGDLLMIISCLYACVFRSASVCLSVRCE